MGIGGGDQKKGGLLKNLISGGLTGAIESCCTYPTEFLKTKMQLYKEFSQSGLVNTAKHTIQESGVSGLYRGLSVLVFFSIPKTGIRFYSKGYYEENFFKVLYE